MAEKKKISLSSLKKLAENRMPSVDASELKDRAQKAGEVIGSKAADIKDSAMAMKEDITEKLAELDHMLESSVTE